MRLDQFKFLSEVDQELYLKEKAIVIGTIIELERVYMLFQIDGFYLEVLTDRKNKIIRSTCYEEELEFLDPYLEAVDLDEIYSILNTQ